MKRRDLIKGLTLLPFAGGALSSIQPASAMMYKGKTIDWFSNDYIAPGPLKIGPQVYQSIGVEPLINCRGTLTIIGASILRPEAEEAMKYAHMINAQLDELAFAVGQRLAEITGAEWGVVSSGCAGGLKIVAAGVLSGGDPEKLVRIPFDTMSFDKHEIILFGGSHYDHSIRVLGAKYIRIRSQSLDELRDAINPRTALVYMGAGGQVAEVAKITNPRGVVLLVDAAANRLTIPEVNLQAGADVVAYSGGKVICGPQSAGLLLGKKGILMAAWQASAPHHGPARDNKVGREEQIGMLAAVESWATRDHDADMKLWVSWLETIQKRVSGIESVVSNIVLPTGLGNASPRLTVTWDPNVLKVRGVEVGDEMAMTKPRVAASGSDLIPGGPAGGRGGNAAGGRAAAAPLANPVPPQNTASISFSSYMMGPGHDGIVADKLYSILSRKKSLVAVEPMKAPAANIAGRWEVAVEFFNGTGAHTFTIEKQEGNYLQGTHKGTLASRELLGTIDGNKVIFQSRFVPPGQDGPVDNSVVQTFYGTLNGDAMSGDVDMGEYITAKFTAKRYTYPNPNQVILVPKYRPLSS